MEEKSTLSDRLFMRHISQHRILKTPPQKYRSIESRTPIWGNPKILEKYFQKEFVVTSPSKPMLCLNPRISVAFSSCQTERKKLAYSFTRKRTVSQHKIPNKKERYLKPPSMRYCALDQNASMHTARSEANTPALLSYDASFTERKLMPKLDINIQKMPVKYVPRSITTAKPRRIAVRNLINMERIHSPRSYKERMKYKPPIIVRSQAFCRPRTSVKDECESPLCGW
jgi:hypothetical protein